MPGNRLSEKFLFLKDLQLVFYTKLKFQTEDQRNIRALPKNTLDFSECFRNTLDFSECLDFLMCIIIKQIIIKTHDNDVYVYVQSI